MPPVDGVVCANCLGPRTRSESGEWNNCEACGCPIVSRVAPVAEPPPSDAARALLLDIAQAVLMVMPRSADRLARSIAKLADQVLKERG